MTTITFDTLATKSDLRELEQRLDAKLETMEMRMTLRLGAMIAAGVAFLSAIKFFGH